MKTEGRHPILPSPLNPRPDLRCVNKLGSPSIAGKLPSKPTNTPKFTDKCSRPRCLGCHTHPFSKVKGAQKLRSSLITRRIVDEAGFARDVLEEKTYPCMDDGSDIEYYECDCSLRLTRIRAEAGYFEEVIEEIEKMGECDNNDDQMSFCEVGFVTKPLDEDDGAWWKKFDSCGAN